MRILHLAKYYWPALRRHGTGGPGTRRGCGESGPPGGGRGHRRPRQGRQFRAPALRRSRRAFSFAALGSQEIAPGYIAAAWKRADIIHVHHPHPLADVACLLRAGRTPVVVTQHADSRRSMYRPVTGLVLRRAAAVVVPSRAHLALSSELVGWESKGRGHSVRHRPGALGDGAAAAAGCVAAGDLHRPAGGLQGARHPAPRARAGARAAAGHRGVGPEGPRLRRWRRRWRSPTGCAGTASTPTRPPAPHGRRRFPGAAVGHGGGDVRARRARGDGLGATV